MLVTLLCILNLSYQIIPLSICQKLLLTVIEIRCAGTDRQNYFELE